MLPSASPTATSSFSTTYDGLIRKLATAQDEMTDAWTSQLQQVLGDQGLLNLVGQLHSKGTWKLDIPGMLSASRQGFALETYQTLLPTVYQRYAITNCTTVETYYEQLTCELPTGQSVIAGSNGLAATWLGPPPDINTCATTSVVPTTGFAYIDCDYGDSPGTVPDSLASTVWGTISDTCNYQPGNPRYRLGVRLRARRRESHQYRRRLARLDVHHYHRPPRHFAEHQRGRCGPCATRRGPGQWRCAHQARPAAVRRSAVPPAQTEADPAARRRRADFVR